MNMTFLRLAVPFASVLYACGGGASAGADLIAPAEASGDASADGTDASAADGDGGGMGSVDAGQSSGQPDGGPKSSDGGRTSDGGAPGGDMAALTCGATSCAIPVQACCVRNLGSGQRSYGCELTCPAPTGGNGGGGGADLRCSAAANCPVDTVCCVSSGSGKVTTSKCQTSCGGNSAQLCDPKAATSGCPANAMCSSKNIGDWNLPSSYATCGGMGN